jgi:glycerophosphoryl diester phosphodiesterase
MTFGELFQGVVCDFRKAFAALVGFETLFKLGVAFVLLPALAALLFALVRWSGRTALANEDILGFALSPWGVWYGFLLGLQLLGVGLLEHAGATAVVALKRSGHWRGFRHAMLALASRILLVLRLTALILAIFVVAVAPFAALAALTWSQLLGGQDINYYLADRPATFYLACTIGGLLFVAAGSLAAYLYVRWVFALCIVLLEKCKPIQALVLSAERTRGIRGRIALVVLGWQLIGVVLQLLVLGAFRLLGGVVLHGAGHSPRMVLPTVVGLLAMHGVVAAAVSGFVVVVHCLLILRLYVQRGLRLGLFRPEQWANSLETAPAGQPGNLLTRLEWGVAAVVLAGALVLVGLNFTFDLEDKVEVQAHRGDSTAAPENTLAAIQKAIEIGADWAEIDVQLTADGEVVILHDSDLRRVTGDPRRVTEVTLDDLQRLTVRLPRFAGQFANERVPTLRDALRLAKGNIKLNIELKASGRDQGLTEKVVGLIKEYGFEQDCLLASLHSERLDEVKKLDKSLKRAAIISASVGDVTRLDVDYLEINKSLATNELLRRAQRQNKKVFVWTVDDKKEMERFLDRGVDSIITNNPELLLSLRGERRELSNSSRLLLACRHLLE